MGTPIFKLVYDRKHKASNTKEGVVELRITYNRIQRFATTGVRILPNQWRDGRVVNRLDAPELQQSLDFFVANARKAVNKLMDDGVLDMDTVVAVIQGRHSNKVSENIPEKMSLSEFFYVRSIIRKYGRGKDSQERYDRFLRWFDRWGGMKTIEDITDINIIKMDEALGDMKPNSKWGNYHRFLNSFILDAIDEGLMRRNPYKSLHIKKDKNSDESLEKYLTREEFERLSTLNLPTQYLVHARDLFIFQTYTCLAYVDLLAFDADKIKYVNNKPIYVGRRGKTNQEYTFLVMQPAMEILNKYNMRLPVMSNQKYNDCLKILAVMAGINKPVSSHWARHTGATLLLNSGVGLDIVAKILGHSSTKITRTTYAKLLDETVADAMAGVERLIV